MLSASTREPNILSASDELSCAGIVDSLVNRPSLRRTRSALDTPTAAVMTLMLQRCYVPALSRKDRVVAQFAAFDSPQSGKSCRRSGRLFTVMLVKKRLQPLDDIRVRIGHVMLLGRVGLEVEEHHVLSSVSRQHARVPRGVGLLKWRDDRGAVGLAEIERRVDVALNVRRASGRSGGASMELPLARAHNVKSAASHRQYGLMRTASASRGHQGEDVSAVQGAVTGERGASELCEGREDVNRSGNLLGDEAHGYAIRPPGDERNADSAVPGSPLHAAQTARRSAPRGAVVGSEDDQRLPVKIEFLQLRQDLAHGPIQFANDVGVQVMGSVGRVEVLRGGERLVRHRVRQIQKEGLVALGFDEAQRSLRIALGEGALNDRVLDDSIVLDKLDGAHIVRVEDAEIGVEASLDRKIIRDVPEVPFADAGGGVALLLEGLRNGDLAGGQAIVIHATVRRRVAHNAMTERIAAGENGRPRWCAIWHRHVEVSKVRPLRRPMALT